MEKPIFLKTENASKEYVVLDLRGDNPYPVIYDWRVSDENYTSDLQSALERALRTIDRRCNRDTNVKSKNLGDDSYIFYREERLGPLVLVMPKDIYYEKVKYKIDVLKISNRDTNYLSFLYPGLNPLNFESWTHE